MPAYSQRKRKIAKKSTRRSKKRLSRRIKTRRGGGKKTIDKFKALLVAKLDEKDDIYDANQTAQNFIDNPVHKGIINEMIKAYDNLQKGNLDTLKKQLIDILVNEKNEGEGGQLLSNGNQVYIESIVKFFNLPE
jgi:hypothetical protein